MNGLQGGPEFIRLETERPGFALVYDPSARVDQIHTIGPARVSALRHVFKTIEHSGKFDSQLADAGSGNQRPLCLVLRAGQYDLVANITFHLPDIAGMCLENVDHQERHSVSILIVELVEGRNLPPKWRSSVTSEHQHDGLFRSER